MIWNANTSYELAPFELESDLENAIAELRIPLFGHNRIYLPIKKKIETKAGRGNIPDGYLIDLSSKRHPRLYVVEVELAKHDPLKHVAVQILEFSLSYPDSFQRIKQMLRQALDSMPTARATCDEFARACDYENIDLLLERTIYDSDFRALVVIDELSEELQSILVNKFKFGVEVIELTRYKGPNGDLIYQFEPFLADVTGSVVSKNGGDAPDPTEFDTIVVPAKPEGFRETFLGENQWHHIRLNGSMIPQIKYVAAYQTAPESAITHIATVKSIESWRDSSKFVLKFTEPAERIGPLRLVSGGRVKAPQGPRYTTISKLRAATTLDDAF